MSSLVEVERNARYERDLPLRRTLDQLSSVDLFGQRRPHEQTALRMCPLDPIGEVLLHGSQGCVSLLSVSLLYDLQVRAEISARAELVYQPLRQVGRVEIRTLLALCQPGLYVSGRYHVPHAQAGRYYLREAAHEDGDAAIIETCYGRRGIPIIPELGVWIVFQY